MNTLLVQLISRTPGALALLGLLTFTSGAFAVDPPPAARSFESLTVRGQTYTRVTVLDVSKRHVSFRSAQGIATVLLDDLDPALQAKLKPGYQETNAPAPPATGDKADHEGAAKVKAREPGDAEGEDDEDAVCDAPIQWTIRNIAAVSLLGIGLLALSVGHIWIVCAGFHTSVLWGICLLIGGFVLHIMYSVGHWESARRPVYVQLIGVGLLAGGWSLFAR